MLKVLSFLKPYRLPIVVALILTLVELAVELLQPILIAKVIDDGILQKDLSVVLKWGGFMVGISLLAFLSGIINSFFAAHSSQSFGYDVRKALFVKVQSFSFNNLQKFETATLITRMTNDVTQLQNTVFMSLRIMLRAPLLIIGGVIMALLVNFRLALLLVITIPLLVGFLIFVMTRARKLFQTVQDKLDHVNGVMRENLSNMKLIKAFVRGKHEMNRFDDANKELRNRTITTLRLIETSMPVLLIVMNASILAILWFGSADVNTGDAKVGEVVAIINYATRITGALSVFTWIIMHFSRARASAGRVTEVLDTEVDLVELPEKEQSFAMQSGRIDFKDVRFNYEGSSSHVLDNLSFSIKAGTTVVILGATGSGKSTLFQLIPRLYDVSGGSIIIDGHDVKNVGLDDLRKQIGFVPQEALLFTGTIKENIAWGKEDSTMGEIIEAAKSAQIHHTIEKLPLKYETVIGQKGVNLSGGQKQRISIARALVRNPKILLLDDSTSALDLKTEAQLLQSLKKYTCTTLIITQKIYTAMAADSILLLEDGGLIAEGNHQELLKTSPFYQKVFKTQFGEGKLNHASTSN
ncbi:ABC transporter ATP-binding protein [Ferdinandcohnia quinoae]|uniref:ABC transporter ATP-binding protein/permease n=1 Tax=Fredinandcohnia quinoae TaxID=2918902 RepID=A0AAW5E8H1_9BACI|nr:ABC transporter ATP-binding protein [Fredinandcohnia sp. SECRCQ15]MCH1626316.1 ABC transporter ATP-binding protein/permease [Fredinandcohnia sp. SECRCQ15]